MPEAAEKYTIIELELCHIAINKVRITHLLKRVDFDAIIDHLALTHIITRKAEPATIRIKILLKVLGLYSYNSYYMKGKDMILSDIYLDKNMTKVIHMMLFVYPLTFKKCFMINNIICMKIYRKIIFTNYF